MDGSARGNDAALRAWRAWVSSTREVAILAATVHPREIFCGTKTDEACSPDSFRVENTKACRHSNICMEEASQVYYVRSVLTMT